MRMLSFNIPLACLSFYLPVLYKLFCVRYLLVIYQKWDLIQKSKSEMSAEKKIRRDLKQQAEK